MTTVRLELAILQRMTHIMTKARSGTPANDAIRFRLERCPDAATLYVCGSGFGRDDIPHLVALIMQIPPAIRTLRVDMYGMEGVPLEILMALRNVLSEWRELRRGNVRLMFRRPSDLRITAQSIGTNGREVRSAHTPWSRAEPMLIPRRVAGSA